MRQTNFKVGELQTGYDSNYTSMFRKWDERPERITIDPKMRDNLGKSHWDHSRSWGKNFMSETT